MARTILSAYAHRMIRLSVESGEATIREAATAWGTTYANAWLIARGKSTPFKPSGAAAGAWKDYGPTCKRGHPRPDSRDRRARRCRPCDAMHKRKRYIMDRLNAGKRYSGPKIRQLGHGVQAV